MAAYAALVSLLNLTEQMQNHPRHSFSFDKKQIESLADSVRFLLDFIESYNSHGGSKEAESLEREIASAAFKAESVIESHIKDQIHAGSSLNRESNSCFLDDLQKVIKKMDSNKKMAVQVKAERESKDRLHTYSTPATSSKRLTSGKNTMVGFDDVLLELVDMLTGQNSGRRIISIMGMGGAGKTTLARNAYENKLIQEYFDICLWATLSQECSAEKILLELLSGDRKSTGRTFQELGVELHKFLSGRRYLIVLDDMWSATAWDKIQSFFPENGNGSCIVVTTRLSNIATYCGSKCFEMSFLDEDKSWQLFCEKAFAEKDCPPELEQLGKKIVKKCRGLPLSIVVIGGHMRKSLRKEYWQNISNDINSVLDSGEDGNEQCFSILSLSYSHLPAYLKPCFLYMGTFQEDSEIRVSKLIRFWVAEGFLKPSESQSLEEVAEVYLKDLIERNLILVRKWSRSGKIKTCNIHDLVRELCLMIAKKENFVCALNRNRSSDYPFNRWGYENLDDIDGGCLQGRRQQVNLRYCDCQVGLSDGPMLSPRYEKTRLCHYLPSSIFRLWNLQTLIMNRRGGERIIAPSEIWEMPQLRHLIIRNICLPDPPPSDRQDDFVLRNLQTLLKVENFRLTEEVCRRIPNIKRLEILYDHQARSRSSSYYSLHNLWRLKKLESLACDLLWDVTSLNLSFPSSLRKLSLGTPNLHLEHLTEIGSSLPHLEVLKLSYRRSVVGCEFEGEFSHLKSLTIWGASDFILWTAGCSHFPVLENLTLGGLHRLSELPPDIEEIETLRRFELDGCSPSSAISAMRILVAQEELGNDGFQLQVRFWDERHEEKFREMLEREGLKSNNLLPQRPPSLDIDEWDPPSPDIDECPDIDEWDPPSPDIDERDPPSPDSLPPQSPPSPRRHLCLTSFLGHCLLPWKKLRYARGRGFD